jgi:hypothetical protein
MSWIKAVKDLPAKKSVLDALVDSGRLTGGEYYCALSDKDNVIKAIEDESIHKRNIIRLGAIFENQDYYKEQIKLLDKELSLLEAKYFNANNKRFNAIYSDYRSAKINPEKYYKALLKYIAAVNKGKNKDDSVYYIDLNDYPNISKYISANDIRNKLNFKKISAQLSLLINKLKSELPYQVFKEISEQTKGFSDLNNFYLYALQIIKNYSIELDLSMPDLKLFFEYAEKERGINVIKLVNEEQRIVEKIRFGLSDGPAELEIAFAVDFYPYLKDYLAASITSGDYKYFSEHFNEFKAVWEKYTYKSALNNLKDDFENINAFYEANFQRDGVFAKRLGIKYSNSGAAPSLITSLDGDELKKRLSESEITVVVTGGFHSESLKNVLVANGVSYVAVTPNITSAHNSNELYAQIAKEQAKSFSSQTIAPALNGADAKIEFKNNAAYVEIGGQRLILPIDEKSGKFKLVGAAVAGADKPTPFSMQIARTVLKNIAVLQSFSLSSGGYYAVCDIIVKLAEAAAHNGYFNANGLIFEIANNPDLQKAIEENSAVLPNTLASLPDFIQSLIASKTSFEEIKKRGSANPVEAALLNADIFGIFIMQARKKSADISSDKEAELIENQKKSDDAGSIGLRARIAAGAAFFKRAKDCALSVLYKAVFILSFSLIPISCVKNNDDDIEPPPPVIEYSKEVKYIRDIANKFLLGNLLPRSFVGSTNKILDPVRRNIAEGAVVIYDAAVLLKALVLYPEENKDLIEQIVNALKNGSNIRSNNDFSYSILGEEIPLGHGLFWKIIGVNAQWFPNQNLPIVGENAWIASAMASVHRAYQGTPLGDDAYAILKDLTDAICILQMFDYGPLWEGYIRMAPRERNGYAYLGPNYWFLVSTENNISCIPALQYMSENAETAQDRQKYKETLTSMEDALFRLYNQEGGYFYTGHDLSKYDDLFAADCQTWLILALGPSRLDKIMKEKYGIDNASVELLKTTLKKAGVQKDGKYIGVDFYDRKEVVSTEWTLGFISAAAKTLALNYDSELQSAVDDMSAYIESLEKDGLLPSTDQDDFVSTGHGWFTTEADAALAPSAWLIFKKLGLTVTPFDILYPGQVKAYALRAADFWSILAGVDLVNAVKFLQRTSNAVMGAAAKTAAFFSALKALPSALRKKEKGANAQLVFHSVDASNRAGASSNFGSVLKDENGNVYVNVYFADAPDNLKEVLPKGAKNAGWRTDNEDVWASFDGGILTLYSKAPRQKVIKDFNDIVLDGKNKASSFIRDAVRKNAGVSIDSFTPAMIVDHNSQGNAGQYNEWGAAVVSADVFARSPSLIASRLLDYAQIRDLESQAVSQHIYMYMDGADLNAFKSYLKVFNASASAQMIVDYEMFSGLSEKQISDIISLAKDAGVGVCVNVSSSKDVKIDKSYFSRLGFSKYFVTAQGKMYKQDYFSQKTEEVGMIEGYKNGQELADRIRGSAKTHKVLKISEIETLIDGGSRSIADRAAILNIFKSAVLKLRSNKMASVDYVRSVGYNFTSSLTVLPQDLEAFADAVNAGDAALAAQRLGIAPSGAADLYLKQLENSVNDKIKLKEVQIEFLKALTAKALAQAKLKEAGFEDGLDNKDFEITLGEKLLERCLKKITSLEISKEAKEFIDSETGSYNDLNDMIMKESAKQDFKSVNAAIALILLSAPKARKITIDKRAAPVFNAAALNAILSAA